MVGGREERNWKGFHMVTVAIGTIYQLPKVSVPKKVRSTKKKNQRSKRRIYVSARSITLTIQPRIQPRFDVNTSKDGIFSGRAVVAGTQSVVTTSLSKSK